MSDSDGTGPRQPRPDEFPQLLSLVDRCFGHETGGMRASNPHCYDPERPGRHAVVVRGGEVVAHAACIPETLVCARGVAVPCWGVSGVATDPRYAGDGHMQSLLNYWLDRLDDEDVPLARLWGDRARYGRFGFETVGRERRYRVTRRSFTDPPDRDRYVRHYDGELGRIPDLYGRVPNRVSRTRAGFETLFSQRGLEVLVYRDDATDTRAYLAFTNAGRDRRVTELAGDERGVEGLLAYLFRAYYTDAATVNVHSDDPLGETLRRHSVDWTDHTHKQVRVNDLPGTLSAFGPQLARRLPADGTTGELTVGGEDGTTGAARIRWDGEGGVEVDRFEGSPDVVGSRRELARLLFDEAPTDLPAPFDAAFPLSFFVPRTGWV